MKKILTDLYNKKIGEDISTSNDFFIIKQNAKELSDNFVQNFNIDDKKVELLANKIINTTNDILCNTTKNFQILFWYIESNFVVNGFSALNECLELLDNFIIKFPNAYNSDNLLVLFEWLDIQLKFWTKVKIKIIKNFSFQDLQENKIIHNNIEKIELLNVYNIINCIIQKIEKIQNTNKHKYLKNSLQLFQTITSLLQELFKKFEINQAESEIVYKLNSSKESSNFKDVNIENKENVTIYIKKQHFIKKLTEIVNDFLEIDNNDIVAKICLEALKLTDPYFIFKNENLPISEFAKKLIKK